MKLHQPHPSEPFRARCGTAVADPARLVADPDRVSCARCAAAEPDRTRRFGLLRYAFEAALDDADRWLRPADGATVQLARHLADQLDAGHLDPADAATHARQLGALYRSLGLSPDGRPEHLDDDEPDTPLSLIRSADGPQPLDEVDA